MKLSISFLLVGSLFIAFSFIVSADENFSGSDGLGEAGATDLYVVNFTADWCPNCKILDPALEQALRGIDNNRIRHISFDMTDSIRSGRTFDLVNGTVLAGVYGDYLGVTGLVVMIAADSGEKIDCATRLVNAGAIRESINQSYDIVQNSLPGTRETDSILCPPSNRKIAVPTN